MKQRLDMHLLQVLFSPIFLVDYSCLFIFHVGMFLMGHVNSKTKFALHSIGIASTYSRLCMTPTDYYHKYG